MAVIEVSSITKIFRIPQERKTQLKEYFVNPFKKNTYKDFKALDNVSFSVEKGEFLGIIGRNGSGKSTLLKIISNIFLPNRGYVKTEGKVIPFLELGVGFNMELTAKENIFLNGVILGMSRSSLLDKYKDIINFAELEGFENTQLKNFSSGMQVRLAFSIAIQAKGDIYILDEVLAVGDMNFQQKCFNTFRKLKKEGKTIVFVSHSMGAVEEFCDRVILLDHGKIQDEGEAFNVVRFYSEMSLKNGENTSVKKINKGEGIVSVKALNLKLEESSSFNMGDYMKLRINYSFKDHVEHPIFEISLYRNDGLCVASLNTKDSQIEINQITGNSFIDLNIENINFFAGSNNVSIILFSEDFSTEISFLENACSFEVFSQKERQSGVVEILGKWEVR